MKIETLLVPVDFLDASRHTVDYALKLAESWQVPRVILYHAYAIPVTLDPDPMFPRAAAIPVMDVNQLRENSETSIAVFKDSLQYNGPVTIETHCELNEISTGITEAISGKKVDMVIIGVNETSGLEQSLIGTSAVTIARNSTVPVIIVPPQASFSKIEEIGFASDLQNVENTTPLQHILQIVKDTGARFFIANVRPGKSAFEEEFTTDVNTLYEMFEPIDPQYIFVENKDFTEGINQFAEENDIDLLIVVPKERGWFENLFHSSRTKKLAYNCRVPLMVMH
jgi:nucleotide-binding universal stress UspA family protein